VIVDMTIVPKHEKTGFLEKQGGRIKSWKKRWFILYGKHLAYYERDDSTGPLGTLRPKGCIHIHEVSTEPTVTSKYKPPAAPFLLHAAERSFLLVAPSAADRESWCAALQRVNDRPPAIFCTPCQRLVDLSRCAAPARTGLVTASVSGKPNYLVLAQSHLAYYLNQDDVGSKMALGLFHLAESNVVCLQVSEQVFALKRKSDGHTVSFVTSEATRWVHDIQTMILSEDDDDAGTAGSVLPGGVPGAGADGSMVGGGGGGGGGDDSSSSDEGRGGGRSRGGRHGRRRRDRDRGDRDRGDRGDRGDRDRTGKSRREGGGSRRERSGRDRRDDGRAGDDESRGGGGSLVDRDSKLAAAGEFADIIVEFLQTRDGRATTHDIMSHFKSQIGKEESTAFSVSLSKVSKFNKDEKQWVLKPDFE